MSKDFCDCNVSELTIRDFFAAVALHAFICKGSRAVPSAEQAYNVADIVLYEREHPENAC